MTRTHVALVLALGLEMQAAQGLRASGSVKGHKSWVPLEKFCFTPTTDPETVRGLSATCYCTRAREGTTRQGSHPRFFSRMRRLPQATSRSRRRCHRPRVAVQRARASRLE